MYRPSRNNDLNWCMANADSNYHCSVSVILGVAERNEAASGLARRAVAAAIAYGWMPAQAADAPAPAYAEGAATFQANCAVCHGRRRRGRLRWRRR